MLGACAPMLKSTSSQVVFNLKGPARIDSGLRYDATPFELSDDYCYALHITGDAPSLHRGSDGGSPQTCSTASPPLGQLEGVFRKGATAEIEVAIGPARRFDLLAVPKSKMPNGACNGVLRGEPRAPNPGGGGDVALFLNNQPFLEDDDDGIRYIATGKADVVPGTTTIDLVAVSSSPDGAEYGCHDDGSSGFTALSIDYAHQDANVDYIQVVGTCDALNKSVHWKVPSNGLESIAGSEPVCEAFTDPISNVERAIWKASLPKSAFTGSPASFNIEAKYITGVASDTSRDLALDWAAPTLSRENYLIPTSPGFSAYANFYCEPGAFIQVSCSGSNLTCPPMPTPAVCPAGGLFNFANFGHASEPPEGQFHIQSWDLFGNMTQLNYNVYNPGGYMFEY